ncbi:MAG: ABC transporter ATP-binding protein [Fibromonadaceae bacterium]|jgi:energy-coupling factor transporter ATP-binding protein EcfA2|nr:ABC transporter ATP-binding protein [Fibromonadaceae bacterium]
MILQKFDYFEFANEPKAWSLNGMVLGSVNLVVGKNATGKTKTLTKIARLGNILAGKPLPESANYDVEFSDGVDIYKCKLNISHRKIQSEEFCGNKEKFVKWVEGLIMHAFNSKQRQDVIDLYTKGEEELAENFKEQIINFMNEIGYELLEIGTDSSTIYVKEKNVDVAILLQQMSQGMFRALSLIIQMAYNTLKNLPTTIIIDDIGEGLDFARSTSMIKLLSRVASEGKCQLIMSTNDRFVMNNVPLKYWQVIQRTGGQCKAYNYHNKKEKYDEFEYTGLNNFDFLATDFINSEEVVE